MPSDYSPVNIQALSNRLYVEFAPAADVLAGTAAPGEGAVDVFNAEGQLQERLVRPDNTHLNQPWAVAMAPSNFGSFSHDLVVGNFGDGTINAFNPKNGRFVGELKNAKHQPIAITHLWGLAFGNGGAAGPKNTLYFTAGLTSRFGQKATAVPRRIWLPRNRAARAKGAMTVNRREPDPGPLLGPGRRPCAPVFPESHRCGRGFPDPAQVRALSHRTVAQGTPLEEETSMASRRRF